MITPTIGRVVHYRDPEHTEPQAAIVAYVHSDHMVNLTVFDHGGFPSSRTSVNLRQPGEDCPSGPYCEWMPYQVKKDTGSESGERDAGTEKI